LTPLVVKTLVFEQVQVKQAGGLVPSCTQLQGVQ